ncbi:polyketide cyclase/dehydrase/lipid transport protein [Lutibacter sp. Hel_I_33_5]|uniref:SRPBCC family protein n=1 Tax=Lutibacter sp. Hel_I_33_5 TaxID=1566289 RepID=UPI0011A59C26|nr:SRPBCC family protein [Lutibacter sp. Hel_I_33_5]TVZ55257.1 polyketide cyclase/dehydrase/lipid transport protein [Lutibacter sp. Hel_I_33_5]
MKAIKIILGIITALVIIFFATGLIVKETAYTSEVEINKPIDEVFAFFVNPETLKKWLPEVKSFDPIEEKEGRIGSTYKMIVDNQGQDMVMIEKILAYVENEKMTFQFDSDQMLKVDDFNFTSNGSATKMIQHSTVKSKSYMMACLFPYFKGMFEKQSQEYMNSFKKLAEN